MVRIVKLLRLSAVEYEDSHELVSTAAAGLGIKTELIRDSLRSAGERVGRLLRLGSNPLSIEANAVRIAGVAGLLRIAPRFELEIVPKFLDTESPDWREDFFYLSMLSHHGRLLAAEHLASAPGAREDLATLVARAVIGMFWENQRRPLRTYRLTRMVDFSVDGEVDAEALVLPSADGYEQEVILYGRQNAFNATIISAVNILLTEVRDPQTRRQLSRVGELLAPQRRVSRPAPRMVPSRSKRWQSLYDLAGDIVKGFGVTYNVAWAKSPGFVLDTWRVWEDTVTLGLRLGLGSSRVRSQVPHELGYRHTFGLDRTGSRPRLVNVVPDVVINSGDQVSAVIDAKYKTRWSDNRTRIVESDIYEALAFSIASNCQQVVLAYPDANLDSNQREPGTAKLFERIVIGNVVISGINVTVQGVSRIGGLRLFAQNLAREVAALVFP